MWKQIVKNKYAIFCSIIAGILISIGLMQDQHRDVLIKAIRICLECVGIG